MHWIIGGDTNANAAVRVEWRKSGGAAWHNGPPLFRVERGAHRDGKGRSSLDVPEDAWLFAGSVVLLAGDTDYQLRLTPDRSRRRRPAGHVEGPHKGRAGCTGHGGQEASRDA